MARKKDYYLWIRKSKNKKGISYYITIKSNETGECWNYEEIFHNSESAKKKKTELEFELIQGKNHSFKKNNLAINNFFEIFIDYKTNVDPKSRWISEKNKKGYINHIGFFKSFCEKNNITLLSDINGKIVLDFQSRIAKMKNNSGKEFSDSYKRKLFGILKSALDFAWKKDFIPFDPSAKFDNFSVSKEKQNKARPISISEIISFIENCSIWKGNNHKIFDYTYFKDFFLVLLYTGMRAEECVLLQKEDFFTEVESGIMYIKLPSQKTKMKYSRIIPIHPGVIKIIIELLGKCQNESDYIWKNRNNEIMQRDNAIKIFKKIALRAGLTGKVTSGSTRKTFITIGSKYGKLEIQKIVGHKDSSVTGDTYHMPSVKQLYEVLVKIDFGLEETKIIPFNKRLV